MGLLTVPTDFWRPLVSRVFCHCTAERAARAPELPQPRTQFVVRGGILQRTPIWQRLGSHHNIALELLLPWTHAVARGSMFQRIHRW